MEIIKDRIKQLFKLTPEVEVGGQYIWRQDKGGGFPTDVRG